MPDFDVASELKAQIAKEDDKDRRTVLLLMLGVLEDNRAGLAALGAKIDTLINDEASLRLTVLNGHAENHDRDHEFVDQLYVHREAMAEERRWIRERMRSDCALGCEWASRKMKEETDSIQTAAETAKADRRAARDTIIRIGLSMVIGALSSATGILWLVK